MLHDTILHQKKWIIDVMIILMMEGLNSPSGQLRPHQASCAASAIFPGGPFFCFFLNLREGNPDVVIAAILISVSDGGKERRGDNKGSLPTKMH